MTVPKKAIWFVAITYLLSWALAGGYYAFGGRWNTPAAVIVALVYMYVPLISAIGVEKRIGEGRLKEALGISFRINRWFAAAWLIPAVLALATFGVSLLFPMVSYSPGLEGFYERLSESVSPEQLEAMRRQAEEFPFHPFWIGIIQALLAGPTINALAAFGEETGWRGLLQRQLDFLGFWKSALLIGLIWGVWHAPLILQGHNYPHHPLAGVFMMIAWTMLLSPGLTLVRWRSGSVLAAAIAHGSLNASVGLAIILIAGGSDLVVGLTGLAGFVVLLLLNGIIALNPAWWREQQPRDERSEEQTRRSGLPH
jgi:membrane protease YdiL (CAAX protease family)